MRTGDDYLRSLKDGRRVFVDGEHVKDVTAHPAFRQAARSIAMLYRHRGAAGLARAHDVYLAEDRRAGAARLADSAHSCRPARAATVLGNLGRGDLRPDGPRARPRRRLLLRLCGEPAILRQPRPKQFADNLVAFYEFMRDNHVYCSYAIVPPQIDRSKPAHKQSDPTLYAGVVKERDDGIVISGAQQLATGGAISDYIHLSCIHPLQPGDENYANCLAVPVAAPRRETLSAASVCARRQRLRLSAVEPVRRIRQLRRLRQCLRAVGARLHLPQCRIVARSVAQDAVASARQSSGADALCDQAALHGGPGAAHERDDRQFGLPPCRS